MRRRLTLIAAAAALAAGVAALPAKAAIDWDRAANIKGAATQLAALHRNQGSQGVLKFLDACYRTHLLASEFNAGVEACLAQDYMHSQALARIYARVPPDVREKNKNPSPEEISKGFADRFVATFAQYKLAAADATQFKALVDKHGLPVFLKGVFPNAQQRAPQAPGGGK